MEWKKVKFMEDRVGDERVPAGLGNDVAGLLDRLTADRACVRHRLVVFLQLLRPGRRRLHRIGGLPGRLRQPLRRPTGPALRHVRQTVSQGRFDVDGDGSTDLHGPL